MIDTMQDVQESPAAEAFLTPQERDRIWAEEYVRHQAREEAKKQFEPRKSLWARMNSFLNSALGLWVLSTIVIGFGTYSFKQMQERDARRTESERLEIELRHRLSLFHKSVSNLAREIDDTEDAGNDPWGHKFASRLRNAYRSLQTPEAAFFSTYAHDNLQALFTSLQDKLRGLDDKKARGIEECFASLKKLRKNCEDDYNDVPRPDDPKMHEAYFKQLKSMVGETLETLRSRPLAAWTFGDNEPTTAKQ
jgi:hypothetical protein